MQSPRLRNLAEFAEQEIILPEGPFAGRRYKLDRSPAARLWFDELDSNRWTRAFFTGPNQDGKSLNGFVIPTLHSLFERKETVILGVPSLDMVSDKWNLDLQPVIKASRYRDLLPRVGAGSRGGDATLIQFRNGAALRFMTEGGDDQARAGFASGRLNVTEVDGFDNVGGNSREGDKFSQLERRLLAFGDQARTIGECTVSTEQGRIWQEYTRGTQSRIAIPCPHCGEFVTPDREHLVGWQDAEDEIEAIAKTVLICPACACVWSNSERIEANKKMVLVHKGQSVDRSGVVTGPLPRTKTLGFRWTVVNCVLNPKRISEVGGLEWKAKRAIDEDAAERNLVQSQWAKPAKPAKMDVSKLDAMTLMNRVRKGDGRGIVPGGTLAITVACDVGKWLGHWVAIAWLPKATPHILDYGVIEMPSGIMVEEEAILLGLRGWRDDVLSKGWMDRKPSMTFVDAGYKQQTVIDFCNESPGCLPVKGFGVGQERTGARIRETGTKVIQAYDHYSELKLPSGDTLIEIDMDHWTAVMHGRMGLPIENPLALTLYDSNQHLTIAKHLTAERGTEEFIQGMGVVRRFETLNRNNHYGDATRMAMVAGDAIGMKLIEAPPVGDTIPAEPDQSNAPNFVNDYRGKH